MAHPYHHALASVKKWGGEVSDYLPLHTWFDQSNSIAAISGTGLCGITPRASSCWRPSSARRSRCRPAGSSRRAMSANNMCSRISASSLLRRLDARIGTAPCCTAKE